MRKAFVFAIAVAGLSLLGVAQEADCTFSGVLGMEFAFIPTPPATLEVETTITLGLSFAGASVESRTVLSLEGLEAEHIQFGVELGGVTLTTAMRFDPCFSKYWFEVRGGCCPFDLGALFLVENLAPPCQTPDFTVGIVLDLGLSFDSGFFVRSLTGFGVEALYHLIDEDPATDLLAVPGWWFEEELLHLGFATDCLRTESIFAFDELGFSWAQFYASYTWQEPVIEIGARVWLSSAFAFDRADFILGFSIDPVSLRSVTSFDWMGFLSQEIDISIEFSGIRLYSRTLFDFTGLISVTIGFELSF